MSDETRTLNVTPNMQKAKLGLPPRPEAPEQRMHTGHAAHGHEGREANEYYYTDEEIEAAVGDHGLLPKIPARNGFAHRWVRVSQPSQGNVTDGKNLVKRGMGLWKPRDAANVDVRFQGMATRSLQGGEVIAIGEMVLYERPLVVQKRREQVLVEANRRMAEQTQFSATETQLPAGAVFSQKMKETTATGKRAVHMAQEA